MDILIETKEIAWQTEILAVNEIAMKELRRLMEYGSYETKRALHISWLKDLLVDCWSPEKEARYLSYAEKYGEDEFMKPVTNEKQALKYIRDLKSLLEIEDVD